MANSQTSTRRKSLVVSGNQYRQLLEGHLPHECYFNSFSSTRRPSNIFSDGPMLDDITITRTRLQIDLPYPISSPLITHLRNDKCTQLLKKKEIYDDKIKRIRRSYDKHDKNWLTKKLINGHNFVYLPEYIVKLTTGAIEDENPYIDSCYDYFYTGGDLCQLMLNDVPYLVRPISDDQICFTNIKKPKIFHTISTNEEPIFNITSYSNIPAVSNFITIRQKNRICLSDIKLEENSLKQTNIFESVSKVPYLDAKIYEKNEIAMLDAKYNLTITDIKHNQIQLHHNFPLVDNKYNLAQFDYLNTDTILFMNVSEICLLDKRSLVTKTSTLKSGFFECNELCTFSFSSCDNNYVYIISKHNIMKVDLRELKIVDKWTHLLAKSPTISKVAVHNSEEYLCVSSFDERILLQINKYDKYLPLYVPNVMESFTKCNSFEEFHLGRNLEKRMQLSISGMELIQTKSNGHLSIFTCNSIGDIFRNNLNKSDDSKALVKLNSWINLLPKDVEHIKATSLCETNDIKNLLNKEIKQEMGEIDNDTNELCSNLLKFNEEVNTYHLSTIWNGNVPLDVADMSQPQPISKVSDWLLQNTIDNIGQGHDSFDATKYDYDVDNSLM